MRRGDAEALIRASPFAEHGDSLCASLRPAVSLATEAGGSAPGESRFGGAPDLEAGADWPVRNGEPLAFLAQLRLEDLAAFDLDIPLPAAGLLQWFYDWEEQPWGFDPADGDGWQVRCVQPGVPVAPATVPAEQPFTPCRVRLAQCWTVPDLAEDEQQIDLETEDDYEAWERLTTALGGGEPRHRVGGHPNIVQNEMQLECQLASNGINCGSPEGYADPRVAALQAGAQDWRLLLQLDTDDEGPGWMWGDCGMLYFWTRTSDIATAAFDSAWCVLQCY